MPYKIYTYADPYQINRTDFWEEIKSYPHLCASRTLVNGLLSVMRRDIAVLLCPLDDIVKNKIFSDWERNIGLRIQQYGMLSELYRTWNKKKRLNDNYYSALSHNKDLMLDALRLFIELDIKAEALDARQMNMEHRMFVRVLKEAEQSSVFALPPMPAVPELIALFNRQAEDEKAEKVRLHGDKEKDRFFWQDIETIDRMIAGTKAWDGKHVVIHGIHQFTPLQLRFISHLDRLGVEVIFIYNYLPEFKEIYSSWSYIYQQFDAPIHHDQRVKSYAPMQLQKPGNAIASNLGLLCEENMSRMDVRIRSNYALYKDVKVQEFDNVSEYAGYVSDAFLEAEESAYKEIHLYEKPVVKSVSTAAVLSRMEEIVYTANKDVDALLQVYHPEYARNRHFLAYPIGQFFAALYALWNADRKEIDIEYVLLRECVNSGVLSRYSAERLLKTLMNAEPVFANISTFSEFKKLFGEKYRASYDRVNRARKGSVEALLGRMNIYNFYKITKAEIDDLFSAVSEINDIAVKLFSGVEAEERFQFKKHFERLEEFVRARKSSLVNEEEKELIA